MRNWPPDAITAPEVRLMQTPVLTRQPDIVENYGESGSYQRYNYYKTRPRFIVPTPYNIAVVRRSNPRGDSTWYGQLTKSLNPWWSVYSEGSASPSWATTGALYNHVYSRFIGKMRGDGGELGAGLVEYSKTADFVRDRAETLADYVTNIDTGKRISARDKLISYRSRRFQRPEVLERFERAAKRERWAVPRWLGARWLEAWMVIAPTMGDLHNGLQVLGRDLPLGRVKAKARWTTTGILGPDWYDLQRICHFRRTQWLQLSADVTVVNSNRFLLQTLGLLNPAVIAGQVTPWSWMVGWFVNWEQYLNSWTDFAGTSIKNICISHSHECDGFADFKLYGQYKCSVDLWAKSYGRLTPSSVPAPTLNVTLPNRLSVTRAATSISLIVTKLTNR